MVYNVDAVIEIEGTQISNYYSLNIQQHFNEHHKFTVRLPYEIIESKDQFALNKVKDFIGKVIIIRLVSGEHQKVFNEFKGIITEVGIEQYDAYQSQVVLKGFSPTIALENGPHIDCFFKKNLSKIVNQISSAVTGEYSLKISPVNTQEIKYLTQYKESHFEFLNRLSAEYGEWFFFNGKDLVFGKPSSPKEIGLISGEDVYGIEMKLQLLPMDSKVYGYSYLDAKPLTGQSPSAVDGLGQFGSFTSGESHKLYNVVSNTGIRPKFEVQADLDAALKVKKTGDASQLEMINGTSINPEIVLGATTTISISKKAGNDFSKQEYGKFVIVGVTHEISEDGNYKNTFQGLPAQIKIMPVRNVKRPVAEPQVAFVTDNKDPDKLGRVKVKMMWQSSDTTDWIRVMTPNGGPGGKTGKNRGFAFVPEVDDEVIVGFSYNDPDWPFVLGSVYNGKSSSGSGDKNSLKTLGTQSGHLITFNDDEKSLFIEDAKGNHVNFDGKGKILIEASDGIELKCGQGSIVMSKDGKITIKGSTLASEGSTEITMKAPNISAKADSELKLEAANVAAKAQAQLKLEGAMVAAKAQASVSVEGAMAKLAGSGITEISGGIVKIN